MLSKFLALCLLLSASLSAGPRVDAIMAGDDSAREAPGMAPAGDEPDEAQDERSAAAELRAAEQRYQALRRQARQRKIEERAKGGAPSGWIIGTHLDMLTSLSSRYVPTGMFMGLDVEKAITPRFGLKASWAGNTSGATDSRYGLATIWESTLQLRGYPLNRGPLNGFFAGVGLHYSEQLYQDYYTYYSSYSSTTTYQYWHSIGHSWGVGPTIGYQWVIGRTVAISLEGNYRYHWVQDDSGYYNYVYNYSAANQPATSYNSTSLDFKSGVGWAF